MGILASFLFLVVPNLQRQASCNANLTESALQVTLELTALGLNDEAIEGILGLTDIESIAHLEQLLGRDNEAVVEIKSLFALAESSGSSEYLEFDPSVVRGLAYYTGQSKSDC